MKTSFWEQPHIGSLGEKAEEQVASAQGIQKSPKSE